MFDRMLPNDEIQDHSSCVERCFYNDYDYAGLQLGNQCFCGNHGEHNYTQYGELPQSSCNINCPGNENQVCGGSMAMTVLSIAP